MVMRKKSVIPEWMVLNSLHNIKVNYLDKYADDLKKQTEFVISWQGTIDDSEWIKETYWKDIKAEARSLNFFLELEGLRERASKGLLGFFDIGRMQLFSALECIFEEESAPSLLAKNDTILNHLKCAGERIFISGLKDNLPAMHDPLIWLFIPKKIHKYIEVAWDGIGDWRA